MSTIMNKVEFGVWVREERGKREWSQADLARESGLYRSIINNIENGVSESAPKTLRSLAHAFNVPVKLLYEFLNYLPTESPLSYAKRTAIFAIEEADEEDAEFIYKWLNDRKEHKKVNLQYRTQK